MGLSGWFFNYPLILMIGIFLLLSVPLWMILFRSSQAPRWNIRVLWIIVLLMTLRSISVFAFPMATEGQPPISSEELPRVIMALSTIVGFALVWAIVWTKYFKESARVRRTFS